MPEFDVERPWEELDRLAAAGEPEAMRRFLVGLPAGEARRALSRLEEASQTAVLTGLGPADAADLMEILAEAQAADMIEELPPGDAAAILAELPSNEQADLINELDDEEAAAILSEMPPADAASLRELAAYPGDVAGGLMSTEYLAFRGRTTAGELIDDLRRHAEAYSDFQVQYLYVIDQEGRLTGVLGLRDLLMAPADAELRRLMIPEPVAVPVDAGLDELSELFEARKYLGLPVVDGDGRLVGVLRRRDLMEAVEERAEGDYRKSLGIVGGEELRSMPVLRRAGRRLSWLSVNIFLNVIAASVIAFYQDTLAAVIALAAFLPIISDMSGCSGNQAVAVSMRELSLGLVQPREVLRTWFKEVSVGLMNGVALGVLLGFVAWLWQGNVWLGLVVGSAMAINTVVAVSIGGTIPLVLRRLGLDPALASGPLLTTVTDLCGFLLALGFATALLPRILAV